MHALKHGALLRTSSVHLRERPSQHPTLPVGAHRQAEKESYLVYRTHLTFVPGLHGLCTRRRYTCRSPRHRGKEHVDVPSRLDRNHDKLTWGGVPKSSLRCLVLTTPSLEMFWTHPTVYRFWVSTSFCLVRQYVLTG